MQHKYINIKHYCNAILKNKESGGNKENKRNEKDEKDKKSKWPKLILYPLVLLGFFGLFCSASVFADDLLKGALPALKENFGTDSVVVRIIYLADILTSILIYIKTKDYKIAGSILITLIYLTYTLGQMVFKGI